MQNGANIGFESEYKPEDYVHYIIGKGVKIYQLHRD